MVTSVRCLPKKILVHYQLLMLNFRRLSLTIPFEWKEANIIPLFKKG